MTVDNQPLMDCLISLWYVYMILLLCNSLRIIIIMIKNLFSQKIHVVFVFNKLNDLLA